MSHHHTTKHKNFTKLRQISKTDFMNDSDEDSDDDGPSRFNETAMRHPKQINKHPYNSIDDTNSSATIMGMNNTTSSIVQQHQSGIIHRNPRDNDPDNNDKYSIDPSIDLWKPFNLKPKYDHYHSKPPLSPPPSSVAIVNGTNVSSMSASNSNNSSKSSSPGKPYVVPTYESETIHRIHTYIHEDAIEEETNSQPPSPYVMSDASKSPIVSPKTSIELKSPQGKSTTAFSSSSSAKIISPSAATTTGNGVDFITSQDSSIQSLLFTTLQRKQQEYNSSGNGTSSSQHDVMQSELKQSITRQYELLSVQYSNMTWYDLYERLLQHDHQLQENKQEIRKVLLDIERNKNRLLSNIHHIDTNLEIHAKNATNTRIEYQLQLNQIEKKLKLLGKEVNTSEREEYIMTKKRLLNELNEFETKNKSTEESMQRNKKGYLQEINEYLDNVLNSTNISKALYQYECLVKIIQEIETLLTSTLERMKNEFNQRPSEDLEEEIQDLTTKQITRQEKLKQQHDTENGQLRSLIERLKFDYSSATPTGMNSIVEEEEEGHSGKGSSNNHQYHTVATIHEVDEVLEAEIEQYHLPAPHVAAIRGDLSQLQSLCQQNMELLLSFDDNQRHPIFYAMAYDRYECVEYFLTIFPLKIFDLIQPDCNQETPLHAASSTGSIRSLKILLSRVKEADEIITSATAATVTLATTINHANSQGMTCCHVAKNAATLEVLLSYKANIFLLDNLGRNPLFVACAFNRADVTEYLIHYSDDNLVYIMQRDHRGDTPLHAAACNGAIDCLLYLLQYAIDPSIMNERGFKAIELAIQNGHGKCQEVLMEYTLHYYTHSDFDSVLFLAVLEGHKRIKQSLKNSTNDHYQIIQPTNTTQTASSLCLSPSQATPPTASPRSFKSSSSSRSRLSGGSLTSAISLFSLKSNQTMKLQRWGCWIAYHDHKTNKIYWFNSETHVGQWEVPPEVAILQQKLGVDSSKNQYIQTKMSMKLNKLPGSDWIQYLTKGSGTADEQQMFYYNQKTGDFQYNNPLQPTQIQLQQQQASPSSKLLVETTAATTTATSSSSTSTRSPSTKSSPSQEITSIGSPVPPSANKPPPKSKFGDWQPYMDPVSGYVFWYNTVTQVSQWDCPKEVQERAKKNSDSDDDDDDEGEEDGDDREEEAEMSVSNVSVRSGTDINLIRVMHNDDLGI